MGLDSFEGDAFRRSGTTGYQYKFYPSPLASAHRTSIERSLVKTAENQKKLKLKKWILVLPDDLAESATRKDGGDVSWFESLRARHGLTFELEHWGHKALQSLFLQHEALCLFYYPELIPRGAARKKTLQDTRKRYDDNLLETYGKIEFVGMSVYKEEATRGVPMEHIYIPLSAVPEAADDTDPELARTDSLDFLARGARHVVLGDPGSGKSTLLRFLTLVGTSAPLQKRCKTRADDRLPIFVTLRRYADDLKERRNLALIDHIIETTQADFSLKAADLEFFEYCVRDRPCDPAPRRSGRAAESPVQEAGGESDPRAPHHLPRKHRHRQLADRRLRGALSLRRQAVPPFQAGAPPAAGDRALHQRLVRGAHRATEQERRGQRRQPRRHRRATPATPPSASWPRIRCC